MIPARAPHPPPHVPGADARRGRWWLWLWLALAAVLVARATLRPPHRGVILDHLEFGRRLVCGEELYGPWRSDLDAPLRPLHAPYPPSFGLLTAPFAAVAAAAGDSAARACWALVQVAAIAALAFVLRRLPTGRSPPGARFWSLWLLTLLLGARFVLRDMHGGGGNLINVALCALAFLCAERGQPARAGWLLGASLLTKPTQVWLLPVLLLLGHRRAALHTLLAGAAGVALSLALLRFDVAPWLRWLEGSWALATQSSAFAVPALGFPEFEWMNQSLRSATGRWLGEVPPEFAARVPGGIAPGLGLPVAAVAWITRAFSLLLFAWLAAAAWRARRAAGPLAQARTWVLAAALLLSVLLSPLSWKAHHVALLPALFLLVRAAIEERSRPAIGLLAVFVPFAAIGGEILGDALTERVNSLHLVTMVDLLLLAAALRAAGRTAPERVRSGR